MVEEESTPEVSSGTGGKKKIIVIILVALLALALAAFLVNKFVLSGGGKGGKKAALKEEAQKESTTDSLVGPMVSVDPIIANLADQNTRKFIKIKLELELNPTNPADTSLKTEVEKRMPQFRDLIITSLTTKTSDQLYTPDGKAALREEILSRLNSILMNGKIRNIYFSDFVIQ